MTIRRTAGQFKALELQWPSAITYGMPRTKTTKSKRSPALAQKRRGCSRTVSARLRPLELRRVVDELQAQQEQLQAENEHLRANQRDLEASRSRYTDLYDLAPVGYLHLNATGLLLDLNLTAAGMLGGDRVHLVGLPFPIYVSQLDVPKLLDHLSQAKRSREPVRTELMLGARCGELRWVQMVTMAMRESEGRKTVFHAALMDISERKRAEQALLASEKQYRLLFERNPHPMWISNRATLRFLAVNDAAISSYGYTRKEFLAMTAKDLRARPEGAVPFRYPDGGPGGEVGALPGFAGVWKHRTKAGTFLDVEITRSPVVFEGQAAWLVLAHDITARRRAEAALQESEARFRATFENGGSGMGTAQRKRAKDALWESEARLQAIMDNSPLAIFLKDTEGRYLTANRRFESVYGVSRERVVSRTDLELFATEQAALIRANDLRVLETGQPLEGEEIFLCQDVTRTHFVSRFPVRDLKGRVHGICGMATDVTERKQTDEKLKKYGELQKSLTRQLLEVQETERRHIARELHDQLGQLLTALKLSLRISADHPSENFRADLERAEALVSDLTARVRDLSLDLRPSLLDDLGLLPALLWHFDRYAEQTRVQVAFSHLGIESRRFEPQVETAAYRIVQEALNNVARHAGVKDATVRVCCYGGRLRIQVADRGQGFDPADALADTRSRGLAGMRERTNLLGGELTVDSALGAGTRLTAELLLGKA